MHVEDLGGQECSAMFTRWKAGLVNSRFLTVTTPFAFSAHETLPINQLFKDESLFT